MPFLDRQVFLFWASGIFLFGQMVPHEGVCTSWSLDPFVPDTVNPCIHGSLGLTPHGAVSVFSLRKFVNCGRFVVVF